MIEKVAPVKTSVLIIGESGTGKELIARMIHERSAVRGKPFVPVNCGAIPETLIESEMFGHKRGSFTGAVSEKQGLFEVAHTGTLFLDEVGELPLSMQVKLLRAIQERSFRKVGGTEDIKVDVRIIAATNRDLEIAVNKGTFREDLYYRLNVIQLKSPALRDRPGDVKVLAHAFLKKFSDRAAKEIESLSPDCMLALENWTWPGNVRELENVLERAVTLENDNQLSLHSLPYNIIEAWEIKSRKSGSGAQTPGVLSEGVSAELGGEERGGQTPIPREERGGQTPIPRNGILILPDSIRLAPAVFSSVDDEPIDIEQIVEDVESEYMRAALKVADGKKDVAARLLGISSKVFRSKLARMAESEVVVRKSDSSSD
jgi:transcriptional regulator with PAS, ATPase and Fis domain